MDTTHYHQQSPVYRRPTVLAGSSAGILGRMSVSPGDAAASGIHGIDLDLRRAWQCPPIDEIRNHPMSRIKSVWLPMQYAGPWSERRAVRLRGFLTFLATRCGLRTIVLPKNTPVRHQGVMLGGIVQQLADWCGLRVAVSITADAIIQQSGSHLERVANMRRVAEEWDLDIALDLTAPGIEQWEAEAALMRLFPRLTLVRMRPWLDHRGQPVYSSPARVCMRSAAMLADQAFCGIISIEGWANAHSWWSITPHPGLRDAIQTRADILAQYERVAQLDIGRRHHLPGPGTAF